MLLNCIICIASWHCGRQRYSKQNQIRGIVLFFMLDELTGKSLSKVKLSQRLKYSKVISNYIYLVIVKQMQNFSQYNPLKWPPDLQLAQVHMKCVCPGKDNIDGIECPCCGRLEKIKTKLWYKRRILKDFKSYGGGIPGYFQLLKYCWATLAILALIVVIFHVYVLQTVCPLIKDQYQNNPQMLRANQCQQFFFVFKLCDSKVVIRQLQRHGLYAQAFVFFYLQLFSFIYLIVVTIGMKLWLQKVNSQKIVKEEKVYSYFSLMLKNIPKFYQLQNLKLQLEQMVPGVDINQLFFVYEIAQLQNVSKKLFDLHFQIEHTKDSIAAQRGATLEKLHVLIEQYKILYKRMEEERNKLGVNNGRAIVVFNTIKDCRLVYKKLRRSECVKFIYHTSKIFGSNSLNLHFFADKLPEPQQIIWKYVGESSITKTVVRIKTTLIGFGFILCAFLLLYFPIIKINEENIRYHSTITSVLSVIISVILQVLSIVYRLIILRILPARHPSSRQSESYFIVITTVVFHFFFYIVAPGTYFAIRFEDIPMNVKLKQLFVAVCTFLVMTIIVAFIDLRYRLFNNRRKKIMGSWTEWGKYCQMRLHEQIRWPSFPIQFKLMVVLNIWSFNAFYIFQIPYLLFLFVLVITVLYWLDKKNIYRHYKMQVFQSIDLQISVQRDYIIMFLVCVCCGYAVCVEDYWQYFFIGAMFILSLLANWILSYRTKQQERKQKLQKSQTLNQVLNLHNKNPKQSFMDTIKAADIKQNLLVMDNASTISLGSAKFQYGYRQIYDNYLNQFKNKYVRQLLQKTYNQYTNANYKAEVEVEQIRRTTYLPKMKEGSQLKNVSKSNRSCDEQNQNKDETVRRVRLSERKNVDQWEDDEYQK